MSRFDLAEVQLSEPLFEVHLKQRDTRIQVWAVNTRLKRRYAIQSFPGGDVMAAYDYAGNLSDTLDDCAVCHV